MIFLLELTFLIVLAPMTIYRLDPVECRPTTVAEEAPESVRGGAVFGELECLEREEDAIVDPEA